MNCAGLMLAIGHFRFTVLPPSYLKM